MRKHGWFRPHVRGLTAISSTTLREGGGGYSPLALFAAGEKGGWYDPSDPSTMFKDTAGTIPVTADGDRVARINDKSGNGNHATQATTAARPLYKTSGGLSWLLFDGIDDFLATSAVDCTATDKMSVFAGVRKLSDAAVGIIVELGASVANGRFNLYGPGSAGQPTFGNNLRGDTADVGYGITASAAPYSAVLASLLDIGGAARADEVKPRLNGVLTQSSGFGAAAGTGNFGNHPLYIGMRDNGAALPFNGQMFQIIVRGAMSSGSVLSRAEAFVASKTGVTL